MQAYDDGWIRVEPHGDGIWRIEELYALPFCRGAIWIVEGRDRTLMLDGGWGLLNLRARLPALFERPLVAVASHSHFDHVGSLHLVAERLAHPLEAGILADPTPLATQSLPFLSDYRALAADPLTDGFDGTRYRTRPAPVTATVEEGAVVDLGGRRLTVLHTPGHSPGHVCLFEETSGFLFSADAIYDGPLFMDCPGASVATLLETHARLAGLPVSRVFPGHFRAFDGPRMRQLIDGYRRDAGGRDVGAGRAGLGGPPAR